MQDHRHEYLPPRRAHFDYFRSLQNPMLGVTVDVDVTALRDFCKGEHCSFYLAFMRCAARAANGVAQFYRNLEEAIAALSSTQA